MKVFNTVRKLAEWAVAATLGWVLILFSWAPAGAADWTLELRVSSPDSGSDTGTAQVRLELGVASDATDAFDGDRDVVALPAGPLQAYINRQGQSAYPGPLQFLWRDIRGGGASSEWPIEIQSGRTGSTVRIAWTAPPELSAGACRQTTLTLTDLSTGQMIGLHAASGYEYVTNGSVSSPDRRSFTVGLSELSTGPSSPPEGLSGLGGRGFVRLSWIPSDDGSVAGYHVWRRVENEQTYSRLTPLPIPETEYADLTVSPMKTYYYSVTAVDVNGCESAYSPEVAGKASTNPKKSNQAPDRGRGR